MIRNIVLLAALAVAATPALAAEKAHSAQQQKMGACNKEAKEKSLAGDDRKAFMKECLSAGKPEAKKKSAQQEKMSTCNKEAGAKGLKGNDRKAFMKDCLKA